MKILKSVLFTVVLAFFLSLSSCHQPLTELLIAAIEDDYNPVIIITAPSSGDTYYSSIDVAGHINDDSLSSGDDKGLLRSISFVVANDLDHKGRINIDAQGNTAADAAFGNIPIIYDSSDRSFSFSVPTSDLGFPPLTLYLQIYVVDFNGNESAEILQLQRSEGPYIDLTQPASNGYVLDENITIQGTVADSIRRTDEAGEVATLKLEILTLGISAVLDLTNSGTGVPLITRPGTFNYDPALRTFQTFLYLDSNSDYDKNLTNMVVNIIATDLNGNTTTVTRTLTQVPDQGPTVIVNSLQESGSYFYSGSAPAAALLWVNDIGTTRTPYSSMRVQGFTYYPFSSRRIATAELQLASNTINIKTHPNTIHYGPDESPFTPYFYPFDYYIFDITYSEATIRSFVGDGNVNLTLTAIDNTPEMRTSIKSWQLLEDSSGPYFSVETALTNSGTTFVGDTHTITFSFRLNDGAFETGVYLASLTGSVGGLSFVETDFTITETATGSGIYDCSLEINASALTQGAGTVLASFSVSDYIGNPRSINQTAFDQLITYAPGAPSLTSVSIAADTSPFDAAKPGDYVTLTVSADQDLDPSALSVSIAGATAAITGSGSTLSANAQIPLSYNTDPVGFTINGFENMVGTAGTVPGDLSGIFAGSDVTLYAGTPSLDTRTVTTTSGDDKYAATGETITVTIVSSQPLDHGPTVDIGGNSVTATGSGSNWTATTTNPSDGEGTVSLEFSDIVNIVGESSSPATITGVSSGDLVEYYPGKPTITVNKFEFEDVGGGAGPDIGDLIVLEFSVDNSRVLLSGPTVSPSTNPDIGLLFGTDQNPADDVFRFEYALIADDIGSGATDFDCTISSYFDSAGTEGDSVSAVQFPLTL